MNQNIVKQFAAKLDETETGSLSSFSTQINTRNNLSRTLYDNVVKQVRKNEDKFNRVFTTNTNFDFQLYRPKLNGFGHLRDNLNVQLLEKQLDRLMEDECKLDKELSKINFKIQEDEELKELETTNRMDHFSLLHSIWHKPCIATKTDEKIDEINCKVATIKNHIRVLAMKETTIESVQLQKYVQESKEYNQLKQKLHNTTMQLQVRQHQLNKTIQQLTEQIEFLTEQNQKIKYKFNDQCEKSKRRQEEMLRIMQKYQQIQLQILKKEKQLKKSKQNHQQAWGMQSSCKRTKYVNKLDGITVYVFSESLETDLNLHTSKSLNEIKNYLTTPNPLANLIQGKLINIPISLDHLRGDLFDKLNCRPNSKRKNHMERDKNDQSRSQIMLGSQDKKKRFQRCRLLLE